MIALADSSLFDEVAKNFDHHSHASSWWEGSNTVLTQNRTILQADLLAGSVRLGPLGEVAFSQVDMGAISSVDLFGLDEIILFAFYWANRHRYQKVVDMGANVGLHSVVLGLMKFQVDAYEPDPHHVALLEAHIDQAGISQHIKIHEAAVAPQSGRLSFVRVLGNTTGSHILGAKDNPYGELETFEVETVAIKEAVHEADLVKMDVEGLEADLLSHLDGEICGGVDVLCEVGTEVNAAKIWSHFNGLPINIFSQKVGWQKASSLSDLPTSYREGSLFLSSRPEMPWASHGDSYV